MSNLLLERVDYHVEETPRGTWLRYLYPTGASYAEYRSRATVFGLPFVHYTSGICPETGRRKTAKGFVALGRVAVGVIALGQAAFGVVAFGQAGLGLLFGLGQAASGLVSVGQLALGGLFGVGQFATGAVAIGQFGIGQYVLAQFGLGEHAWTMDSADPAAVELFRALPGRLREWLGL
jgi:hypothetical protein